MLPSPPASHLPGSPWRTPDHHACCLLCCCSGFTFLVPSQPPFSPSCRVWCLWSSLGSIIAVFVLCVHPTPPASTTASVLLTLGSLPPPWTSRSQPRSLPSQYKLDISTYMPPGLLQLQSYRELSRFASKHAPPACLPHLHEHSSLCAVAQATGLGVSLVLPSCHLPTSNSPQVPVLLPPSCVQHPGLRYRLYIQL